RAPLLAEVEPLPSAEEIVFTEIAQHQVAIGDGRHLAAAPVARWSRHGARARWADLQHAEAVDGRDGAAAGADRVDVKHGHGEVPAFDVATARQQSFAVFD